MPKAIINIAKYISYKLGYEIMPSWRMADLELSTHLRNLFNILDIQCVLDVGANKGQYRDFLRAHVGYKGLILSFEPASSLSESLIERSKTDPNWKIFPFALGSMDTELTFNVMATTQFSSFLTPDHSVVLDFTDKNIIDHKETVPVRQLDSLMDELKLNWPMNNIFLKLDTQGFDLEVIKGSEKTLGGIKALQSEVSILRIYAGMPDFMTSLNVFNENGFDISGMFVVSRDQHLRAIEFDAVMINRKDIQSAT